MNNNLGHFHSHATLLAGNGFTVTPTKGKQPVVPRWQNPRPTDPEWLAKVIALNRYAGCNVGIVCGRVIAVDIDELDPIRAELLKALATEHLGPTRWERIGQAPKTLLMYRPLDDDIRPIKIAGCIDLLAGGKQFVAYGIHPDTGQPYAWRHSHHNPATAKLNELPPITAADVRAFADAVCTALGQRVNAIPAPNERTIRRALQSRQWARQGEMNSLLNARIIRDADGRVVDGREAFMTSLTAAEYAKGFITPDELASRVWARFIEGADLSRPKGGNSRKRRDGPISMHSPRLARPSVADRFYSPRGEPAEGIQRAISTHGADRATGTLYSGRCIWLRSLAESRHRL